MDEAIRHVVMGLAYDGAAYAGFQRQPGGNTVQQVVEQALQAITGQPVRIAGAGRTDAGVHAWGQVIGARIPWGVPTARLPLALAAHLPPDVRVTWAQEVGADFHPRFSAISKLYRYLIWRETVASPFWRGQSWHYAGPLDLAQMRKAAALFVGRRDFSAVAGAGRPVTDAVRTVLRCEVEAVGPWLGIVVEADGFLYRMVRAMAGTLWEVGRGAMDPDALGAILAGGRRGEAGPSLPPHGLCLLRVRYPATFELPAPVPPVGPPLLWD